jgi:hypothetical protein
MAAGRRDRKAASSDWRPLTACIGTALRVDYGLKSVETRSLASGKLAPNLSFEELGAKEVDGIPVLGFRTATAKQAAKAT